MSCPHPDCGGLLREDLDFTRDARAYNLPQRRYVCVMGHSMYTGVPVMPLAPRPLPRVETTGRLHARVCWWCQEPFEGKKLQKYCSLDCSHAVDAERTRKRNAARSLKISPQELARLRAIPFGRYVKGPPIRIPYAARPVNLSQAWT